MQAVSLSGLSIDNAEQQKISAWVQGLTMREDGTMYIGQLRDKGARLIVRIDNF